MEKRRIEKESLLAMFLIVLLATVLRLWQIGVIPPGLFGDEVDTGYQAYSILQTGKDYFGNFLPIHFESLGDWRVPLYIYLDVFFVKFLGLTELAVRLPSAILGIIGVIVVYFLAMKITKNGKVALLASFLLAISPWHLQISRIGLEAIFLPILFPLGLIFFWRGVEEKRGLWFIFSGTFLGLTVYAYNTPKLFLPLILAIIFILWAKDLWQIKKLVVIWFFALVILMLPLAFDLVKGTGQARFLGISIFADPNVAETVRLERQNCDNQGILTRALHNKATVWVDLFTKNYLAAVSTDFLFSTGDPNPRHSIGNRGELYLFELPFLLLGLMLFVEKAVREKSKFHQLILFWLVLTPLPSALTLSGGMHAIRLFSFLPWLQILTAAGLWAFFTFFRQKWLQVFSILIVSFLVVFSVFLYLHQYFIHYSKTSGRWWNYGYREIFDYVNEERGRYNQIYISPSWEPSTVYTLFYGKYPPALTQKEINVSLTDIGPYHFLSPDLGRLKRGEGDPKTLYVLNPAELKVFNLKLEDTPSLKFIKMIKAPDGSDAFVIFSSTDFF